MEPREILISLNDHKYPIYSGSGMAALFGSVCVRHQLPNRLVIITDRNVASRVLKPLLKSLTRAGFAASQIILPPGEGQKSLATASRIYTALLREKVGRSSGIVALGGGVIGDLAGFVAATYQRGISLVHVPTTLLSQVDSSVGGKTGVNHPLGKNMIGAFHHPAFVWADALYLSTLPQREIVSGLGEIIKYGIILDREFFSFLESHLDDLLALDSATLQRVQETCCGLKARIVSEDEREKGIRIVLNFGHTVGHGLEAAGGYRELTHGEAVLLGMIAESFLAREMRMLSDSEYNRIVSLIRRVPLRFRSKKLKSTAVLKAMGRDKKTNSEGMRFVLPVRVGETKVVTGIPVDLIRQSLRQTLQQVFER